MAVASANKLMRDAARLESSGDFHEAVSCLEQAKAALVGDEDAAAAGHTHLVGKITARTSAIFNHLRKELYVTLGESGLLFQLWVVCVCRDALALLMRVRAVVQVLPQQQRRLS
jgi:hypothetical protein